MSTVNSQITDSVSQNNVVVLGEAPAMSVGSLYQVSTHSIGLSMQNCVTNQHNLNQLNPAIIAEAINLIKKA